MDKLKWLVLVLFFPVWFLSGCAQFSAESMEQETVHAGLHGDADFGQVAPVFTTLGSERRYNRIGTVTASEEDDAVSVHVDGQRPTIYKALSTFTTGRGKYENAVYRIHFEHTPFSLFPFHLTAGKYPGLLVVLTRNQEGHLVLVTTVHTCGCYVATVPTDWLDATALPPDWPEERITVYGETLPARLPAVEPGQVIEFVIRPETHRIMDIRVLAAQDLVGRALVAADEKSQQSLRQVKTRKGREGSFYYDFWPLTGHVRGAFKWWEMVLLSLPSLDLFVGMDKDYGSTELTGNPFYTSLQPWFRSRSDMNDFGSFLQFYGWNL